MFCPNCGAEVEDDAKFCENCGAPLDESREDFEAQDAVQGDAASEGNKEQDEESLVCPNCGAKIDKDTIFCENCGQRIYSSQEDIPEEEDDLLEEDEDDTEKKGFFHTTAGQVLIGVIAGCAVVAIIIGIYNISRPSTKEVVTEEQVTANADDAAGNEEQSEEEILDEEPDMSVELPEDESIIPAEDADYLVPDADTRYYSESELSGLDKDQLRIARNEIYARHGRKFKDSELQEYFDGKDWYNGTIAPDDFDDDGELNKYEKANIDLIKSLEG